MKLPDAVIVPCPRCSRPMRWRWECKDAGLDENGDALITITPVNDPPHYCPRPKSAPPERMAA